MSALLKGENLYEEKKTPKSELLGFIYGSLIIRLTKDIKDINELNEKIEKMGYEIGKKLLDDLIDDTFDKKNNFNNNNVMEGLIIILLRNYLGIIPSNISKNEKEIKITFQENPLNFFVELPENLLDLKYNNIICGIIKGMLELSGFDVKCEFIKDKIKGDPSYELLITLVQIIEEKFIDDEE